MIFSTKAFLCFDAANQNGAEKMLSLQTMMFTGQNDIQNKHTRNLDGGR